MSKGKKILLGIIIVVGGFFAILIGGVIIWQQTDPEGFATFQEEREKKERLEEQKQEQIELQKAKETEQEEFDPEVVKAIKEAVPGMQILPKEILKKCKAVKSSSDYQTFLLEVEEMGEKLIETVKAIDSSLTRLEQQEYDKHPEVGSLITETKSLTSETGVCIDELVSKYVTQTSCDASYLEVCIPSPPPDLDCGEIQYANFTVLPPDPHGFDDDKDGIGCESN